MAKLAISESAKSWVELTKTEPVRGQRANVSQRPSAL